MNVSLRQSIKLSKDNPIIDIASLGLRPLELGCLLIVQLHLHNLKIDTYDYLV